MASFLSYGLFPVLFFFSLKNKKAAPLYIDVLLLEVIVITVTKNDTGLELNAQLRL